MKKLPILQLYAEEMFSALSNDMVYDRIMQTACSESQLGYYFQLRHQDTFFNWFWSELQHSLGQGK